MNNYVIEVGDSTLVVHYAYRRIRERTLAVVEETDAVLLITEGLRRFTIEISPCWDIEKVVASIAERLSEEEGDTRVIRQ